MALTSLGYMALVQKFDLRVPPLRSTNELADKTGVLTRHTGPDGTTRVIYPRNRYRGGD